MRLERRSVVRPATRSVALLLLVCIAGCGTKSVEVRNEFPVPVMQKSSVNAGLLLSAEFSSYVHREKLPGAGDWEIAIGSANEGMFRQLLDGLFADVAVVQTSRPAGAAVLVVEPQLLDYQFSTPELSFTDFFEAWFKYRVSFHDRAGGVITSWPLTAYGRSEARFLAGGDALRDATEIALRDAAAGFALRFAEDEKLQTYLDAQGRGSANAAQ